MKERVDLLLVRQGFFDSQEKAKRAVMAGLVYAGTERIDKPGTKMDVNTAFQVKGHAIPYVSRGGLKLEKALHHFNINLENLIVLDVGASTGGFTDCALQHGAKLVYAVDVGYGQLDWKLRRDQRVIVMERTNFRYLKKEDLTHGLPQFACIDVSFISLRLIFPVLFPLLEENSPVIALVKPQFEAERDQVPRKGIIQDKQVHVEVLLKIMASAEETGFQVKDLHFSPILGGEGNIEFLLYLAKAKEEEEHNQEKTKEALASKLVEEAHQHFNG